MADPSPPGEPYGGRLVDGEVPASESEGALREAQGLTKIKPYIDFVYDAEKLALGAYSPLEGFMGSDVLRSVESSSRLPGGLPWPIPIVLAPPEDQVKGVREGDRVALQDWGGSTFATLDVTEVFNFDREAFVQASYGTTDSAHPNVKDAFESYGKVAVAGKVRLLRKLELPTVKHESTPREIRELFKAKGWKNVAAYQCRNPPHTAHEYIQKISLERSDVDGLFIQPVIGHLKKGDYRPNVIMDAYSAVVERYYPRDRVVLSSLSIAMRYAGPKAALLLAIIRKNFGATHYIVGRDQAGVGSYYDPYACQRVFDEYDIGIIPLKYMETFYCRSCGTMATSKTCPHPSGDHESTSQSRIRKILAEGGELPMEILRPEVAKILGQGDVVIT